MIDTKSGLTIPFFSKLGDLGENNPKVERGAIKVDLV